MNPRTLARLRLPKPLIMTLGNLKGGAAKTTSSFFLACYFALVLKLKVLVIDADPLSQTGYYWYLRLKKAGVEVPFDLHPLPTVHLAPFIAEKSAEYDVILIDAGGESPEIFKAAVRLSQELLLLTSTSPAEYRRLHATHKAAEEAAVDVAHEINVRVLMTRVPPTVRTNKAGDKENVSIEYREARFFLEDAGYDVLKNYITAGKWYRLAADGQVGNGAENPIDDIGEYEQVGDEIVAPYLEEAA